MISRTLLSPRRLLTVASGLTATAFVGFTILAGSPAGAAQAGVDLGTAASFAVLAGSTVVNTGPSVIGRDLGVSPGTAVSGFPPGKVINGTTHDADAVAAQAEADTTTAYNDAAGRPPSATVSADLGGQRLVAGVYHGATLGLTGTLTLDAQGNKHAVFIFQAATTLITATASDVDLINGANACNVFWQVGSSATLGTDSSFVGTVLALTSVTANTRVTVAGRLLARTAAVNLDTDKVTAPTCPSGPPPTTTTLPASTTTSLPASTTTSLPASTTTSVPASTTTSVPASTTTSVPASTTTSVPASTTTSVPASTTTSVPASTTTSVEATTTTTSVPASTTTSVPASTTTSVEATTTTTSVPDGFAAGPTFGAPSDTTDSGDFGGGGGSTTGGDGGTDSGGGLAFTGTDVAATVAAGLLLATIGCLVVLASRRKPTMDRGE